MSKKYSKYAAKLARRNRGGSIHFQLTTDQKGLPTLNPRDFRVPYQADASLKSFARRRRFDEVILASGEVVSR